MSNKKVDLSRRNFIRNSGLASGFAALSPAQMLLTSIIQGFSDRAYADEMNLSDVCNYVHFSMRGGPARWMYDLPINPNGATDAFGENQMLITGFDNAATLEASYQTHQHQGFHVPHLWSFLLPDGNGGLRQASDLLNNMMMIRGVNLQVDGHRLNQYKQNTPVPGQPSISGHVVDQSKKPMPGIYYFSNLAHKSKSGRGVVNATASNPIERILSPFNLDTARSFGSGASKDLITRALASLKDQSEFATKKTKSLFDDTQNAKKIFERELGNLSDVYTALFAKYQKIIMEVMGAKFHNISDKEIITTREDFFSIHGPGNLEAGYDLRDTIVSNGLTQGNLNKTVAGQNNTSISRLAQAMALTEYTLLNGLSSSITLEIVSLTGLWLPTFNDGTFEEKTNQSSTNDSHDTGKFSTMFYMTYYYNALNACLLELVSLLKAHNKFDDTLIHLSSEFNRSARTNGTGSDHGWRGSNASFISGRIQKLEIAGNIRSDYSSSNYKGAWGVAGDVAELSGRETIIGNVSSTITKVLGTPSPTPNDASFVDLKDKKVVNYAGKPKNV